MITIKNEKRIISLLVGAMLVASVFSGCSSSKTPATSTATTKEATVAKSALKGTLEVWHNNTDPEGTTAKIFFGVLDTFKAENPGVTINESGQATDNNRTRIRAAAAANQLPNVFFTWGYGFSKDMADRDLLVDFTPYLDKDYMASLKSGALDGMTYNKKYYGLPDNVWSNMIYFNTALFEKHGLKIPKTDKELIDVSKKFREKGVQPLIIGGKQTHQMTQLWDGIALRMVGAQKLNDSYTNGAALDDPSFLKASQILYQMGKDKVFSDTAYNVTNPEAGATFANGEIAMAVLNAGFVGVFEAPTSKIIGKTTAIPTFVNVDGVKNFETENLAGCSGNYAVAKNNKFLDASVELAKYVSKNFSRKGFEAGTVQIAYTPAKDWDTSKQSLVYKEIDRLSNTNTAIVMAGGEIRQSDKTTELSDLVIALSMNKMTPEEFMVKVKELMSKK